MMIHVKPRIEKKKSHQAQKHIETGNKKRLGPPGGEKSGEARRRPSHMRPVNLRVNPLQHFMWKTRNRQINKSKRFSTAKRSKLNTDFPIPFLRSLMLRTCERASSAGMMNAPSSSPSGKRIFNWLAKILYDGANCFPISRSSIDLDWCTAIVELVQQ